MQFMRTHSIKKFFSVVVAAAILNISFLPSASADVVSTEEIAQSSQATQQRADIQDFAAREDVRHKLLGYGVSEADIDKRIANLSNAEVAQMHEQISAMPAGQGVIEAVIGILVIFMLLDIAGVTDIFPAI